MSRNPFLRAASLLLLLSACQAAPVKTPGQAGPASPVPSPQPSVRPSSRPNPTELLLVPPAALLPQAAPSVAPLTLPKITLMAGQERHLRLDHLAWSPNRSRFSYDLNDEVLGPNSHKSETLRLRVQASQQDREIPLPSGSLSRLWWLDEQNLAVVMETGGLDRKTPRVHVLYRINPDTGGRAELTRFSGEAGSPEIHSLSAHEHEILFLDAAGGNLNLHVIDGLSGRKKVYPTGLPTSTYDSYTAHQLAVPDAGTILVLAADGTPPSLGGPDMAIQNAANRDKVDVYRLNRSTGQLSKVSLPSFEAGNHSLSPGGRYLLGSSSVRDLLGNGPAIPLQTIGKPQWWSEGVIYAFESAARPPQAGTWIDAATGKPLSRSSISYDQAALPTSASDQSQSDVVLSPGLGGFLLSSGGGTWFSALLPQPSQTSPSMAQQNIHQAAVAGMGPTEPVPLSVPSQLRLRQQTENSPLTLEKSGPMHLRVYHPDGRKGGLFLLLDVVAPK